MVEDYHEWIISREGLYECGLLTKWAPEKFPQLLKDACLHHYEVVNSEYENLVQEHTNSVEAGQALYDERWDEYEEDWRTMDDLITQAWEVFPLSIIRLANASVFLRPPNMSRTSTPRPGRWSKPLTRLWMTTPSSRPRSWTRVNCGNSIQN
jgi:hypothetical protein